MRRDFKSVLKPSAQMFQLCEPAKHFESTLTSGLTKIYQSLSLPMEIKACTYLLDVYGLRITEVLNITNHDIDLHGRIKIKGLKGSSNRIITGGHYEAYFINCKNKNIHPFTIMTGSSITDYSRKWEYSSVSVIMPKELSRTLAGINSLQRCNNRVVIFWTHKNILVINP